MEFIRGLPGVVFWWGWGMVAMLAGGSFYATWWARRNVRAIETQTPVDVSDLSEGYRLAWGITVGPTLRAPLTGRSCAWWKATVWESVRESESSGGHRHVWREVTDEQSDRPIQFGGGKTVAAVWPGEATMVSSAWSDWRGQELPPEDCSPELHVGGVPGQGLRRDVQGALGPRFRYVEQIIPVDVPFFVLGAVSRTDPDHVSDDFGKRVPPGCGDEDRDRDEGMGWRPEPSTLGVLPTPDSVVAEDMSRATWSIAAAGKKPFLLSADHPKAVSAEQELGAKGGLIMGALFAALAALLLWLRLGG